MNYKEIYQAIADNHAEHWGGTFADMVASDIALEKIANDYPEIYAKAQADFNEMLSKM